MSIMQQHRCRTVAPNEPVESHSRNPWPGMAAIVATAITVMTPVFVVSALATPIERELHLSTTVFGLLLSGFFAVTAAGSTAAKQVVPRLGMTRTLAAANTVAIAALAVAAAAHSAVELGAALLLAGAGNALVQPAAGRYIAAAVPAHRLSLASGMVSASLGAAPLLPGLLAGTVAESAGWRVAVAIPVLLAVGSLAAAPLAKLARSTSDPSRVRETPIPVTSANTNRTLLYWTVAAALATIGSNAAASYFIQIGTHSGLSTSVAGMMQSMAGATAIGVRLAVGLLADRAPRRNPAVVAAMMLSGAAGMALISIGTPLTFMVGALLTVAGGWGWTGLLLAAVMRLLPGDGARAGALMQIGLFGGAAISPVTFGALSSAVGISTTILLGAGASLVASAAVLAGTRNR